MTCIVLRFSHEATANCMVAGIPAAARAAHQVALADHERQHIDSCVIAVPGGWMPSKWCRAELNRLAPRLEIRIADAHAINADPDQLWIVGEELPAAQTIMDLLQVPREPGIDEKDVTSQVSPSLEDALTGLRRKGDAIIAATAKPTDGIVSRYINRPISRMMSRILLRFPGVKPVYATIGAAALGIAMAYFLFAGGEGGLVIGAILFQLASIVDGVDGEIARATFRTSRTGAMLDSMTDAVTNLSFFAGLSFNLWQRGQDGPAAAGAIGLILLSVGLFLIGRQARTANRPLTFDAVKERFNARPSRVKQWLIWLTMRDFYAAAAAICVIAGFASQMLVLFATAVAIWLAVSIIALARTGPTADGAAT